MNNKQKMVDELKVNLAQFGELAEEKREFLHLSECIGLLNNGEWVDVVRCAGNSEVIYRLPKDYTLPIEAEDGRRLVTEEERKGNDFPNNINVRWYDDDEAFRGWANDLCEGDWLNFEVHELISVPADFTFEPKEAKRWFFDTTVSIIYRDGLCFELLTDDGCWVSAIPFDIESDDGVIEVNEAELPYLEKPEGECADFNEFRIPENEEYLMLRNEGENWYKRPTGAGSIPRGGLHNHRWCKPKEPALVECTSACGKYKVTLEVAK